MLDMPDRGLFAGFALSGGVIVFILKSAGVSAWPVSALALGLMASYGVLACILAHDCSHRDRLGDNFYYLGFIFTLASMAAALHQLTAGVKIEPIIGGFAVALVTTIFGVAGRVVFTQTRNGVEKAETRAQSDLLEAATLLKRRLDSALEEMETFRVMTMQSMRDHFDDAASAHVRQAERMSAVIGRMIDASEQLVERLDAINPQGELLNRRLSTVADRLDAAAIAMAAASDDDAGRREALTRLGLHVQELLAMFAEQTAALQPQAIVLTAVGKAADALAESLSRLDAAVMSEATRMKDVAQSGAARRESRVDGVETDSMSGES